MSFLDRRGGTTSDNRGMYAYMESPCHFWTGAMGNTRLFWRQGQGKLIPSPYKYTWNHHVIFGQERWATPDRFEGRVKENLFPPHINPRFLDSICNGLFFFILTLRRDTIGTVTGGNDSSQRLRRYPSNQRENWKTIIDLKEGLLELLLWMNF